MIIGIAAHVDAGKTTLSEAMLYTAGQLRSLGRVDHQDTFLDTDTQERQRGITIFSKQAELQWKNKDITILDTPGHVDFSAEMERALTVLDACVLVISGIDGVQGHTRTLWRLLRHYEVPTFVFVNKMDMNGADKAALLVELQSELSDGCMDFTQLVDGANNLETAEVISTSGESGAPFKAEFYENMALCDENLLTEFMETGKISAESIAQAVANRKVFPCFFGSALKLDGVERLMDGMSEYLPDPDYPSEFAATVYKIGRDNRGERLTYMKITGGELNVKEQISYYARGNAPGASEITEKINQIRIYSGNKFELKDKAAAGEICAVTGLSLTYPGQGLGASAGENIPVLEPVLTYRVLPPDEINSAEMLRILREIEEEDPELKVNWNEQTQEINLSIMGAVQLEVLTEEIKERYNVTVSFGAGNISYRETIARPVEGIGHFEPLRHYAEVHLLLEPAEPGSGVTVHSDCSEDVLSLNWQRLIATHVMEREHPGVLTGSPVTDIKVTILTGRASNEHTEGGDFRQATYRAIRHGLKAGDTILLEPYYDFILEVPQENIGRAMTDLRNRFGKFDSPEYVSNMRGEMAVLKGKAPVSTMQDYVQDVYSYTKGLGILTLDFTGYDVCHNSEEVIAEKGYSSEEDTANPTGSVFCAHGTGFYVPWYQVEEYMHLPRAYQESEQWDERWPDGSEGQMPDWIPGQFSNGYNLEGNSFNSADAERLSGKKRWSSWEKSVSGMTSLELDAELADVYAREFGMNKSDMEDEARRRWRKENSVREAEKQAAAKASKVKHDKKGNPIYPSTQIKKQMLVVDGYNIIFAWEDLKALAKDNIDSAREQLMDILLEYQAVAGIYIVLVFDAYRLKENPGRTQWYDGRSRNLKTVQDETGQKIPDTGIEIVYTRSGETADTYIEKLTGEKSNEFRIKVATNDRLEQYAILGHGALRVPASELRYEVMTALGR